MPIKQEQRKCTIPVTSGETYIAPSQRVARTRMDIRQYWKPEDEVAPNKKGLCLRPIEYSTLKELILENGTTVPELDAVVPCYMQSDHMNQLGA